MQMTINPDDPDERSGKCERCHTTLYRHRGQGDIDCHKCGAIYNAFGQRLRDDLYTRRNPSDWDEDISDLEGYEIAYSGDE